MLTEDATALEEHRGGDIGRHEDEVLGTRERRQCREDEECDLTSRRWFVECAQPYRDRGENERVRNEIGDVQRNQRECRNHQSVRRAEIAEAPAQAQPSREHVDRNRSERGSECVLRLDEL